MAKAHEDTHGPSAHAARERLAQEAPKEAAVSPLSAADLGVDELTRSLIRDNVASARDAVHSVVEIMARIREQTGSPLVHEDLAAASHATNDLYRVLARISGRIGP